MMIDALTQIITDNGGPDKALINAGAKHVADHLNFESLDIVSEYSLAVLMIGTMTELTGVGSLANQLMQAPCKELIVKTPTPIVGGSDSRTIPGADLDLFQEVFPLVEFFSLDMMLENHFSCIASMRNLLASYSKMNWLSLTATGKTITAAVYFELSPPAYALPLSLTCTFELEADAVVQFAAQESISFEPWNKAAMRLHLIEPQNQPPIETVH